MPIPEFRSDGKLPEGRHKAFWSEVQARYSTSPSRIEMLGKLRRALQDLASVGCQTVWVDGGFITSSKSPGDYDCCYDLAGMNVPAFRKRFSILSNPYFKKKQQDQYGGEFLASNTISILGITMLDFFQLAHRVPRDKIPPITALDKALVSSLMERKKGIIELSLTPGWESRK